MKQNTLPINLQFFAEGDGGDSGTQQGNPNTEQQPAFDYEKLASIINGKQSITEDAVLKGYFKQQGLSQEEVNQAIKAFKDEKAKNTPDIHAIQTQLSQTQELAQKAIVEKEATMEAILLGIDAKTIPYVLRLADLSAGIGEDGKADNEALKKAINKVLDDVPQLKPSNTNNLGFQVGGNGGNQNQPNQEEALRGIFGIKRR